MVYSNLDFNHKTVLITGGAGFIGSNLALYIQNNFAEAKIVVFDCFRNNECLDNGNPISYGHYKNLIGFYGEVICGNINSTFTPKARKAAKKLGKNWQIEVFPDASHSLPMELGQDLIDRIHQFVSK